MSERNSLHQPEEIEQVILLIRGQRVMLDRDLAALYGVTTKRPFNATSTVFRRTSCSSCPPMKLRI
jgi:hypothetical protein